MLPIWESLPEVDKTTGKPLYSQLSDIIEMYVKKHRLTPGTPIPTESELMERFGLSRTTVRQGIQRLETKGLVRKFPGKGTFVDVPRRRTQVRPFKSLELSLAEQGLSLSNVLLEDSLISLPEWAHDIGFSSDGPVRVIKRLKILKERPFALEYRILPKDVAQVLKDEDIHLRPLPETLDAHPHLRILMVSYRISAETAADADAQVLGVPAGSPLIIRRGIYYNQASRAFMASKLVFVSERVQLSYEFHLKDDNWGTVVVV